MADHPTPGRPSADGAVRFDERLTVPWWWWPLGLGVAALLAAEVHMGYPGVRAWLPYLVTVPLALAVLVRMSRRRVRVVDGELWVDRAHIPLRHLGRIDVIPTQHKRVALGPDLHGTAFLVHCPWVGPVVRAEVVDPDDPTPYWIFSVRRAAELADALRAGQTQNPSTEQRSENGSGDRPPGR